ncbi:MAG: hypothetical protein ACTTKH_04180 [Treponema sp.]
MISCGQAHGKNNGKTPDNGGKKPDNNGGNSNNAGFVLESLKLLKEDVDITKTPYEGWVKNSVTTIAPSDFTAMFKVGTKTTAEEIKISKVELPAGKKELAVGVNEITIKIDAKAGSYKAWEKKVKVTRAGDPANDPVPELKSLRVCTTIVTDLTKKPFEVKTNYVFDTLEADNFVAKFKIGNDATIRELPVVMVGSQKKINLTIDQATEVTIKVEAKEGRYKEWTGKVKVTRQKEDAPSTTGNILDWNTNTFAGTLTVEYAVYDDEKKVANLFPIFHKSHSQGAAKATRVLKDKFVYIKLELIKGHTLKKLEVEKVDDSHKKVALEKNDANGFPKDMKDKGYQVRFKMPDYEVVIKPQTSDNVAGGKVYLNYDAFNDGGINAAHATKAEPGLPQPVFHDNTKVPKGNFVYLKYSPLATNKELDRFEVYKKGVHGTKVNLKLAKDGMHESPKQTGYQAYFEMPDYDVEVKLYAKKRN